MWLDLLSNLLLQDMKDRHMSATLVQRKPARDEQGAGYELFSASLSKAMKAYALFSEDDAPSLEARHANSGPQVSCPAYISCAIMCGTSKFLFSADCLFMADKKSISTTSYEDCKF